ncbi:ABC transporter ATP-binding protein [Nisaea sp.]|uniref:ABC transporter ATP-binding protein n=1 Tax=Nisaea sp. TaxID=2024842 RepID=UPI00326312FB
MFDIHDLKVTVENRAVLDLPELQILAGRFTVILGQNGSGKSTLMKTLARQRPVPQGSVLLNGKPIGSFRQADFAKKVAFVPQHLPEAPGLDTRSFCILGRYPWRGAFGRWLQRDHDIVAAAMEAMNVTGFAATQIDALSGGERQRAWIAMALAQQAEYLLLDEPVSALDVTHQIDVMEHLARLNRETGVAIIVILHDVNLAARYADQIIGLRRGRTVFQGSPDMLMAPEPLAGLYGHSFSIVSHPRTAQAVALSN